MIKSLPEIYPDETAYSYLARVRCRSGLAKDSSFNALTFEYQREIPSYNFLNKLSPELRGLIEKTIGMDELVMNHTLFKYYARFLDPQRRKDAFDKIKDGLNAHLLLSVSNCKPSRNLRYCPLCAKADREKYGEAYFHIEHMIPELAVCPRHACRLIDTDIKNSQDRQKPFVLLEELYINKDIANLNIGDINLKVASYICDTFFQPFNFESKAMGPFLRSRIPEPLITNRGGHVRLEECLSEVSNFYEGLDLFTLTKKRISYIFRGIGINAYDALLIACFEGVFPQELANIPMVEDRIATFDDECRRLRSNGLTFGAIAKALDVNKEIVRSVLLGKYENKKKQPSKFRCQKWDWEKMDKECCLKFDQEVAIKGKAILTKKEVAEKMGLKDSSLRSLPKLRQKIEAFNLLLKEERKV